jgi:transcriptional regulator with XRE-family HTH domain
MISAEPDRVPSVSGISTRPGGGPTVVRIVVGTQLRRLREAAGVTREAAAAAIRASHAKISRLELGRVGFKERDVADLLTLYGVADTAERTMLLGLARQANDHGWWHTYGDAVPSWFEMYVGLEQAASVIRSYEVQFIPGLFQIEDYARAVVQLGNSDESDPEIERRVHLRMKRQEVLTWSRAPNVWAVIDESTLRRPLGGVPVMRAQLDHLIEVAKLPNVTLQIAPFKAGGHAAAGNPFTILRFSEPDIPDVVYLEQLTSALYLSKSEDVDHYLAVMERVCMAAQPATETTDILTTIIEEL